METTVSLTKKKEFIRWFLKRFQMKRRETVWILNYMLSHDHLLKRINFVNDSHYCDKGMVMSTTCTNGIPFRFYNGKVMSADAEKAFHVLRLEDGQFYLQLNFPNNLACPEYVGVLEENPFAPLEETLEDPKIKNVALQLLKESMAIGNKKRITKIIDNLLDTNQKDELLKLSPFLKEYTEILNEMPLLELEKENKEPEVIRTQESITALRILSEGNKNRYRELIDQALDANDKQKFLELSTMLKNL